MLPLLLFFLILFLLVLFVLLVLLILLGLLRRVVLLIAKVNIIFYLRMSIMTHRNFITVL